MLNTARRGPASVTRLLLSSTSSTLALRIPLSSRLIFSPPSRCLIPAVIARSVHFTPGQSRYATAEAEVEEQVIDRQTGEKFNSRRPPTDSRTEDQVQHGPVTKFKELADRKMVCKTVVNTITQDMKLETMTQVQSMTINETLKGIDVIAQARTGTGKTLAFLIPVLQNIINYDPSLENRSHGRLRSSPTDIRAIIISPTRELAEQIAVEAQKVVRNTGLIVQTAVGGSAKVLGLRKIKTEGCHILVGTPGRLNDILSDPYSGVRAPGLRALVLDEADRLLDQGFAPEIQSILDLLPNRRDIDRQTLLFSATVPEEVMHIVKKTMKPDFIFVRTVQEGEQETHEKVPQMIVNISGFENTMPALVELFKRLLERKDSEPFKAIVYFGATAEVKLASAIAINLKTLGTSPFHKHPLAPARVIEMHARLSQQQRTRAADDFRRAKSAIMFSSDVTARGMDFPNVTHVIQVGIPSNRDTYIHRLGRTARGDKKGEGWLFVTNLEAREASFRLTQLPLKPNDSLLSANVDMTKDAQLPEYIANILKQVVDATKMVDASTKDDAYLAALGVYSWLPKKQPLIDALNNRSKYGWGSDTPPAVRPGLVHKLGLHRTRGINVGHRDYDAEDGGPSSRFGRDRGIPSRGGYGGGRDIRGGGEGSFGGALEPNGGYSRGGYSSRRKSNDGYRSTYADRHGGYNGGMSRGSDRTSDFTPRERRGFGGDRDSY